MPQAKPYQPLALRLLHGSIAALIILAIFTGVAIYNIYDGRIGHLPIPAIPRIMGIHKLFGRAFLLVIPFFALYSFQAGRRRLIQADSIEKLAEIGKPIWWYTLHRIVNTLLLIAATFALVSGREMDEGWLKQGELGHLWYTIHLSSWVMMFGCLAVHLLMSARIGGVPLLLSIVDLKYRFSDRPSILLKNLRRWFDPKQAVALLKTHLLGHNILLLGSELLVTIGIIFAWISLIPH
jgi:Prokaryotic cytochrome b561